MQKATIKTKYTIEVDNFLHIDNSSSVKMKGFYEHDDITFEDTKQLAYRFFMLTRQRSRTYIQGLNVTAYNDADIEFDSGVTKRMFFYKTRKQYNSDWVYYSVKELDKNGKAVVIEEWREKKKPDLLDEITLNLSENFAE